MGKLLTVKTGATAVLLPDNTGSGRFRNYPSGAQVTVTDAEYAALPAATTNWVTVTNPSVPDPYRAPLGNASASGAVTNASSNAAASGAMVANVGWNVWTVTGNVTSMTVNANNAGTNTVNSGAHSITVGQPVVGPTPGSAYEVNFKITNNGTFTVAWPAGTKWVGGSAAAPAVNVAGTHIVKLITTDGGATFQEAGRFLSVS